MKKKNKKKKEAEKTKTLRWQAFADFMAQGKSASEAYRLAGYSQNGNVNSDAAGASRILKHPQVAELVEQAKERASSAKMATAIEMKEFWTRIMRGEVQDVVETKDGPVIVPPKLADRIRASDCLARTLALFKEKTDGKLVVTIRRGGDSAASLQKRETE